MHPCTTHRLVEEARPERVTQKVRELPVGVDSAGIMKTDRHLVVIVSPAAVGSLCHEHAAQIERL